MVKDEFAADPKSVPQLCAKAFVNRTVHGTVCRSPERLGLLLQKRHFQPVFSLPYDSAMFGPAFDFGSPVGGDSVLL